MLPPFPIAPKVPIPPSLMLHSPHGKGHFLAQLLDALNASGFTATTYKAWRRSVRLGKPIHNPLLISIDDLTLAQDVTYAWETFAQMKQTLQQAGMVATYGVITTPVVNEHVWREQDAQRWALMTEWIADGFELATHTAYHSCFSNKYSLPRADFEQSDYDAEICDSAELIERQLATHGTPYRVETLILPYGSGYSYMQPDPCVHAGILHACRQTNIRMIAGIPHGRDPLSQLSHQPVYMGRISPVVTTDQRLDVAGTVTLLEEWAARNPVQLPMRRPNFVMA